MSGEARLEKLISIRRLHPLLFSSFTKEEGRRNAGKRRSPTAASCDAARALLERARLSAFHRGSRLREYLIPKARLQARLPGTWSARALPAFACPSPGMHLPSRSSCRETDTQAARERTANPPAGTAPAPPHGLPPEGVLSTSGRHACQQMRTAQSSVVAKWQRFARVTRWNAIRFARSHKSA